MNQLAKAMCLISFLMFLLTPGCKKTDPVTSESPAISVADSLFQITKVKKIDINDYEIVYKIKPPQGENFYDIKLHWSTSSNFDDGDSILLSNSLSRISLSTYSIKRLKQASDYYTRLSLTYKNKKFYSTKQAFEIPRLRVVVPSTINREILASIKSNFSVSTTGSDTSTRVYLDDIKCEILFTNGEVTSFIPPYTLVSKKYALRFERNGLSIESPDSIEVLKGKWSELPPPEFPAPGGEFTDNGLGFYGSCYSNEKGYIIPGRYFHQLPFDHPNFGRPGYVLEFDGTTNQWSKKIPVNPKYFENPICYYANNSIYVVGGYEMGLLEQNYHHVQRMLTFNVNTSTWSELDSLPYPSMINLLSFELNNEFYVGLGIDKNYGSNPCCGIASKKFWKYNPNTNLWTELPAFPGNYEYFPSNTTAFTIGNKAYIFYGAPSLQLNATQELWEFTPGSNSWTKLSLPPIGGPPFGARYQIFSYENKAYFITGENYEPTINSSYALKTVCLEFDPQNGTYKKISESNYMDIMQLVFRTGNKFIFQSDVLGNIEFIPNRTHQLIIE